jgi:RNA methyltransferase, TrmH family
LFPGPMKITSQDNRQLREIRKLRQRRRWRERAGQFVAEGEDLLAAADAAGWVPVQRYCAAGSGLPGVEVDPKLLASASGLASGTRALAVYDERWTPSATGPICVYLHGVHDPGNVGAVLRSAEAFGVGSVAIGAGSADPFGPKAVRASMGAVFGLPLARPASITELPGLKIALVADRGRSLAEELTHIRPTPRAENATARDPQPDVSLLIGSERDGLPEEVISQADAVAHIPIATNSLNAAMAATVALYELTRRMAGQ